MTRQQFKPLALQRLRPVLLAALLLAWAAAGWAHGPQREFTKTINREFGTTANGMTALYNQYGKVNVNTWANNSVKIEITIVVNAYDQRGADRTLERINANFANTAGYVKAETVIDKGNGWWGPDFGNSCQDFKINYEVWLPAGNSLDLKNKYGNSYVGAIKGKLIAEIKHGELRTEALGADAELNIAYGKTTIVKVLNLYGQVGYSALTVGQAGDVQLDTKYSQLKFDRAGTVRLTSRYDELNLGTIEDLRLQTKYSNVVVQSARSAFITAQYTELKLAHLAIQVDADMSYGDLQIQTLGRNFSAVNVIGKHTDTQIQVERGAAFRFDAEGTHTDMSCPSGANVRRQEQSGGKTTVEGFVGDANARGMVTARMSYGDFVLK